MIRWLIGLIRYCVQGRQGFVYWDGRKYREIDPLVAYRQLMTHPTFNWEEEARNALSDNATVVMQAYQSIAEVVREVFQVETVGNGGLTEAACYQLLARFAQFGNRQKKSSSHLPISGQSTVETSIDSAPQNDLDSTSTSNGNDSPQPTTTLEPSAGP